MGAGQLYTVQSLTELLAPFGAKVVDQDPPVYKWKLGWGMPFTLFANNLDGVDYFDEVQVELAYAYIAETKPANWNGSGGRFSLQ